jgi:two-component system CheB/CheR fusion protein
MAALSHELRNPLAPIRSSLAVLQRIGPQNEMAERARSVIDRQVIHLVRIVDDLLDVTRIARGKVHLQRQLLDLAELGRCTTDDHRPAFEAAGIALEWRFTGPPLWVDADRTRLAQVIGNLLGNALKFTPRGGHVTITLRSDLGQAILTVRDDGIGIAPEMQPHLFEPFVQAAQSLDRSRGGLGLGLSMVKGLLELHRGTVEVSSPGVGKGAVFTVRLPRARPPSELPPPPPLHPAQRRVLVIEDSVDAADCLRDLLLLDGHNVQVAYSGPTGLALAEEFQPEVVLCDIGLPGMDGYQIARVIRSRHADPRPCLIALSGYALPEDRRRALQSGFDRHIAKPPSLEELKTAMLGAPSFAPARPA